MAWNFIANLRGPAGPVGPNGFDSKPFPSGGNINDYRTLALEGYWTVNDNTIFDAMLGTKPPVQSPGVFEIRSQGTAAFQSFEFWLGSNKAIVRRTYSPLSPGLGWSPWKFIREWDPVNTRTVLPGQDLDAMRTRQWDDDWVIGDLTLFDSLLGTKPPVRSPGIFTVKAMSANDGGAAFMEYRYWFGAAKGLARRTYSPLSPGLGWSAWEIVTTGTGAAGTSDAALAVGHQIKKEQLGKAKGGTIGTGGRAAVCVRIDHGFNAVQSSIIALARQYNIPLTMAVMADSVGVSGESSDITWATLEGWALNDGAEMANHARSHADAAGTVALTNTIQGNVDAMRTNMTTLNVPSFIQPGIDGAMWGGFNNAAKAENYALFEAGRIILANHAVASGNVPGPLLPLGGRISQGNAPLPLDLTSQVTAAESAITAAVKTGSGLNVYFHPALIGTGGYATLARIEAFFAFLAARVAANEIILLSQAGLALADCKSDYRFDLAPADGWSTVGSVTSQTVVLEHLSWAAGYVWCVEAQVAAGTGQSATVTVTAAGSTLDASRVQVLPDGVTSIVRKYFTLPIGATGLTVSIDTPGAVTSKGVYPA